MSDAVLAVLISGAVTLVVCLVNNRFQSNKIIEEVKNSFNVAQAVTDTKIEELTREVREHNNFAQRMPVVENEIKHIESDIRTLQQYHVSN